MSILYTLRAANVPPYCVRREPEADTVWLLEKKRLGAPTVLSACVIGPCTRADALDTWQALGTNTHP